jgi:hypothetical protein
MEEGFICIGIFATILFFAKLWDDSHPRPPSSGSHWA